MAEGKKFAKPDKGDYEVCEACSEKAGRTVLVHKDHVKIVAADFFGEEDQRTCPAGHPLPAKASA